MAPSSTLFRAATIEPLEKRERSHLRRCTPAETHVPDRSRRWRHSGHGIVRCEEVNTFSIDMMASAERSVVAVNPVESFAHTVLEQHQNQREYRTEWDGEVPSHEALRGFAQ